MKLKSMGKSLGIGIATLALFGGAFLMSEASGRALQASQVAYQSPDNTAANKQGGMTADQQKETAADRDMAKKIRKSITDDKSLSTYGHNVKVIVRGGMVTLKGPVKSDDEKQSIAQKAADAVGGTDKVQNELTVASK